MPTIYSGDVQTMESYGFAITRSYIRPDEAEAIHATAFAADMEPARDAKGELDVVYSCWDDTEIDAIVDNITEEFHETGYSEWEANNVTLRDTVRGFEEHADDSWFFWGSALVYLHGSTEMTLANSLNPEIRTTEILTAGDRLLIRQAGDPPNWEGPKGLDRQTIHGANLGQVETFGDHRSVLYIACIIKR